MEEDEQVPMPTPGRQIKTADAHIIVNGCVALMKSVLSATLNPGAVDAALAAAMKEEPVKLMMSKIKPRGAAKGPAISRSTYNMFVSIFTHAVKGDEAAGRPAGAAMAEAGAVWKGLPEPLKTQLVERFNAVREVYNAKVKAGQSDVSMAAELSAYEEEHGLEPFDYQAMLSHRAPPKTPGTAAAAAAAATPATGKRPASDDEEDEDEEEEPPQAAAAAADDKHKKKHKKHKKDKEAKKEKKDKKRKEKQPGSE